MNTLLPIKTFLIKRIELKLNMIFSKFIFSKTKYYYVLLLLLATGNLFANATILDNTSITVKAKPYRKDGIFNNKSKVGFSIRLKNEIDESQRGNVRIEIKNNTGTVIFRDNFTFNVRSKGGYIKDCDFFTVPFQSGFYNLILYVSSNQYSNTHNFVFAVEPEKIRFSSNRPNDFTTYWEDAKKDLLNVNPNYQVTKRGDLATSTNEVYLVEFKSTDNQTIRGWLTVPKEKGHFPVLYQLPDYVKESTPQFRREVAVFSLNIRGVGNSTDNLKPDYYQYNIYDAKDKKKYIYKGAYLDCLRGVDFIRKNRNLKLDASNIIVQGTGQGATLAAITAALEPDIKGLAMERPLYMDIRNMVQNAEVQKKYTWPVSSFMNFYNSKSSGMSKDLFLRNWDYFDPINFAPYIACPTLVGYTFGSTMMPPQCMYNFLGQLRVDTKDTYVCYSCENDMEDGFYGFQNVWLKEIFKIP